MSLGALQRTISNHLGEMPELAFLLNTDLSKGFTVPQVAEKHGWTEPMVWSLALDGNEALERFKEHGNDSETYFTGVTNVSETTGLPGIGLLFSLINP